jgi:sigma-E factor negative regulatory protein RseA
MKDQLSALIDGEFDIASAEHLITSAKSGGELKQCWTHYHLIGDIMRGESYMHEGFSARLMNQLDNEPIIFHPNSSANPISNPISNSSTNTVSSEHASTIAASRLSTIQSKFASTKFANNSKVWSIAASVAAVMFVGVMVLQLNQSDELAPVEIAQSVPVEYLQAHQAAAASGSANYIQNASFSKQQSK